MKYKDFCEQIIDLVGGKNNIEAVVHCMTRLRFTLKDRNKAKTEDIKALKDVIDVVDVYKRQVDDVISQHISVTGFLIV